MRIRGIRTAKTPPSTETEARPKCGHGSRREPGWSARTMRGNGIECGRRCEPWGYGGGACASSHAPAVPTTDGPRPAGLREAPRLSPPAPPTGAPRPPAPPRTAPAIFRPADHTARAHACPAGTRDPGRGHFGRDGGAAYAAAPYPALPAEMFGPSAPSLTGLSGFARGAIPQMIGDLGPGLSIPQPFPPTPPPTPPSPRRASALVPSVRGLKVSENQSPRPRTASSSRSTTSRTSTVRST